MRSPPCSARTPRLRARSSAPRHRTGAQDDTFSWHKVDKGPVIEFSLSPRDDNPVGTDSSLADIQQSYVPWIVQDRQSLDWFNSPTDVLSVGERTTEDSPPTTVMNSLDQPPPSAYSYEPPAPAPMEVRRAT